MSYDDDLESRSDAATRIIDYGREATVVMPGAPGRPASSPSIPTMPAKLATPVVELDAAQLGSLFLDSAPASPRYMAVPRNAALAKTVSSRTPSTPVAPLRPNMALVVAAAVGLPVVAGVVGAVILTLYF